MKSITKLRAVLPLLTLVISACAYNNPYHKPDVPLSNNWGLTSGAASNAESLPIRLSSLPLLAWWKGFNDPCLNQLIESSLINNNSLNMSRGNIEAAEGELKKVQFQWIPDLSVLLGYSNNPATGFPGLLAVLAPNYTLNVFSQIKEQKRAEYELAAAKAEDDGVKLAIISQVAASYFTYQGEVERYQLQQRLIDDVSHLAAIARKVYRGGLSSEIQPEELLSQVSDLQSEQEVIAQNIITSRNALRYLINQNPGELSTLRNFADLHNPGLIPGALPLTVLANRPDMQLAEFRLRAANQGIGLAASQLLPTLQLDYIGGPVAGNNNYYFPSPLLQNSVNFNDELLKIPAFKMLAFGAIAKARGLDKVSYYGYVDTLQKALRDTSNALSANQRFTRRLMQTESSASHLAAAYQLNQRLAQKGIQSQVEVLRSKILLDHASLKVNQDKLQQLITVVNLYQELAGGYQAAD